MAKRKRKFKVDKWIKEGRGTGDGAAWNVRDGNYRIDGREVFATTELDVVMCFTASRDFRVYPSYVHDWTTSSTSTSGSIFLKYTRIVLLI